MGILRTFGSWAQTGIDSGDFRSRTAEIESSTPSPRTEPARPDPDSEKADSARWARTLGAIVEHSRIEAIAATEGDAVVHKTDLCFGDRVIVTTRNSVYSLWFLGDGTFAVSGGWFDQQGNSTGPVTVNGCTYGGSAIRHDVVAARGLFLEFGNNVSTTRIQSVRVRRSAELEPSVYQRVEGESGLALN